MAASLVLLQAQVTTMVRADGEGVRVPTTTLENCEQFSSMGTVILGSGRETGRAFVVRWDAAGKEEKTYLPENEVAAAGFCVVNGQLAVPVFNIQTKKLGLRTVPKLKALGPERGWDSLADIDSAVNALNRRSMHDIFKAAGWAAPAPMRVSMADPLTLYSLLPGNMKYGASSFWDWDSGRGVGIMVWDIPALVLVSRTYEKGQIRTRKVDDEVAKLLPKLPSVVCAAAGKRVSFSAVQDGKFITVYLEREKPVIEENVIVLPEMSAGSVR